MDFRLKPLGTTCAATGEPLLPGETVMSVAVRSDIGDDTLERYDYSMSAWEQITNEEKSEFVASWTATVPVPAPKKPGLDVDEQMLRFEQLAEEDAPHQGSLTYVLALWLVRKRRLKVGGTNEVEGVPRLEVTGTRGEGTFEIRDQQLSLSDIEAIQAALFETEEAEGEHQDDESPAEVAA